MYKRILVAVDWTPNTEAVLDQTRRLATLSGAEVHILHVQPMDFPSQPSVLGMAVNDALPGVDAATGDSRSLARRMVDDAVAALVTAGIHAEGTLLETPPGNTPRAVLERAQDLHAELIVLGSRHHGWLSAMFRSSIADEVSHHAECPILIVP